MNAEIHPIGSIVLSVAGEQDCDEQDNERSTGPRAWGYIEDHFPESGYSVVFRFGVAVFITHAELADSRAYAVVTPAVMAGRLRDMQSIENEIWEKERCPTGDDYNDVAGIFGVNPVTRGVPA